MSVTKTLLTNGEIVSALGLPADILTKLQTEEGTTFSATANQFIEALVNKIVYQKVHSMTFNNPFKRFESYKIAFGDTIENIFVDLPEGYTFDKDSKDPFEKFVSNVKTLYASINFEMQYPLTIQDALLRRAVLREYGLMDLISNLLSSLGTRKSIDEYQATVYMLNNKNLYADGFETLDVHEEATETGKYKAITQKIVDVVTDFALPCKDNNKLGVMNSTPQSRALLVIKQELLNHINLDFLAGVFNLEKVELIKNIIPVRSFQVIKPGTVDPEVDPSVVGDDIDFVVLDTEGFDIHPALQDSGMIYNPRGKYTNHFTNDWMIIAYKYFYNARAFKVQYEAPAESAGAQESQGE